MKKEITIYELFGLVKDDKAPTKVKYDDVIYNFDGCNYTRYEDNKCEYLFTELLADDNDIGFLNDKVEIIPEEKEWEDINMLEFGKLIEYDEPLNRTLETFNNQLNSLIKNQKKIIEKLDNYDRED